VDTETLSHVPFGSAPLTYKFADNLTERIVKLLILAGKLRQRIGALKSAAQGIAVHNLVKICLYFNLEHSDIGALYHLRTVTVCCFSG